MDWHAWKLWPKSSASEKPKIPSNDDNPKSKKTCKFPEENCQPSTWQSFSSDFILTERQFPGPLAEILDYNINPKAYKLEYFPDQGLSYFCEVGIVSLPFWPLKISARIGQNRENAGQTGKNLVLKFRENIGLASAENFSHRLFCAPRISRNSEENPDLAHFRRKNKASCKIKKKNREENAIMSTVSAANNPSFSFVVLLWFCYTVNYANHAKDCLYSCLHNCLTPHADRVCHSCC
ncbi:MAG: hypothetical protein WCT05_08625 [Lentisphaeria bacterium]